MKMISQQMAAKLNEQIKHEWESEYLYLAMAAWCLNHNYDGFGAWLLKQAGEEHEHGMKFLGYLNDQGAAITIPSIGVPTIEFKDVEDIYRRGLEHEKVVTQLINGLVDLAFADKDHATREFLGWFVKEQVEEEKSFSGIIAKLERIRGSVGGLFQLEHHLGKRA
jgi:ferritin